jgi:outer membrane usher protein
MTSCVDTYALGGSSSYLYPELSIFNLSVAGSHSDYGFSPLAAASFQRQLRWLNFSVSTRLVGKHYMQIGLQTDTLAPLAISSVSTGISFGPYGSLGFGYIQQNNQDKTDVNLASVSYNVSLGNIGALNLGYLRSLNGQPNDSLSLTFTTSLGERTSASLSGIDQQNSKLATLQVQQGIPRGNGMGYRVIASEGSSERFGAAVNLQNEVGLYNAEVAYVGGQTGYRGNIGGVAMMAVREPL